MNTNTTDLKSFNYLENGRVTFSMLDTVKTTKYLDAGLYSIFKRKDYSNPEIVLTKEKSEEVHEVINYHFISKINEIFSKFFNENIKLQVKNLNYNHKVGILLHGKQGTSKSSILKYYYNLAIKHNNALVFYFQSLYEIEELWTVIMNIRKIQNNPIIIYLDEFDECFINDTKKEEFFKIIMDGHLSIDNCIFLAATNYIDKIPKTILDRPSRIKYSIELEGLQDENLVREFITSNLSKTDIKIEEKELNILIKKSIGKTIDELKEIILDKVMNIEIRKSANSRKMVGFK